MRLYNKMKDWYYKDEKLYDGLNNVVTNEEDVYIYNTCVEIYNSIVYYDIEGVPYINHNAADGCRETYFGKDYLQFIEDVIESIEG